MEKIDDGFSITFRNNIDQINRIRDSLSDLCEHLNSIDKLTRNRKMINYLIDELKEYFLIAYKCRSMCGGLRFINLLNIHPIDYLNMINRVENINTRILDHFENTIYFLRHKN